MARYDRSKDPDPQVQQVIDVLAEYEQEHANALIEARRGNYDFIYIRIIDPDFRGMKRRKLREDKVWPLLHNLPGEIVSDIISLVVVTPEEAPHNGSSIEFDNPLPPLPIPNLCEETQNTNGHQHNYAVESSEMLNVPLSSEEALAVKEAAQLQGLSDEDLIRSWVLEKLELSSGLRT